MEYNSFYGGRRGASFIITKSYKSINDMVYGFKQGGNYKIVNYDEYVIIDTENKNDADNGKIYRRGYKYNDNMGGAIYVGQIVGPAGLAPHLELDSIANINQKAQQEGFEYRKGNGEYTAAEKNLVPGKYVENNQEKFNDTIKWSYCSVRDNKGKDSTAYIGFTIPYLVVEYDAKSVDPYYNRNNSTANFINTDLINRVDDKSHPFFNKWEIKIPKGIKGNSIKEFRIVVASTEIEMYPGRTDDIENHREVFVYDAYDYSTTAEGIKKTYYAGPVHYITKTTIDNRQHLLILYSDAAMRTQDIHVTWDGIENWADLGYIGSGNVGAVAGRESDTGVAAVANKMPPYSAWFIVEN